MYLSAGSDIPSKPMYYLVSPRQTTEYMTIHTDVCIWSLLVAAPAGHLLVINPKKERSRVIRYQLLARDFHHLLRIFVRQSPI